MTVKFFSSKFMHAFMPYLLFWIFRTESFNMQYYVQKQCVHRNLSVLARTLSFDFLPFQKKQCKTYHVLIFSYLLDHISGASLGE